MPHFDTRHARSPLPLWLLAASLSRPFLGVTFHRARVAFLCDQLGIYGLLKVPRCFPLLGAFGRTSFAPLGAIGALVSECYWLCR